MTTATTPVPFKERTVGQIAATLPGATAVFREYGLDFCCGGDVALTEAAAQKGIDPASVEAALAALDADAPAPAPQTTDALIDHILTRYHETHRRELPELIALARKVEAVHTGHARAPRGLADTLKTMSGELEVHMKKEELILFPMMRRGGNPMIVHPIAQMRHDHDDHAAHLRRIHDITGGFELPAEACRSWQALYAGTAKFVDDLMEHIHLENNLLFARFEAAAAE